MGRRDERLRLHALSEGRGDLMHLTVWCEHVLAAGITSLRIREPSLGLDEVLRACERLRPRCEAAGALLFVTDHVACVVAGLADGLQIGAQTQAPERLRANLGHEAWIGFSAHDQDQLATATRLGCDFALLSPVWATGSKPGAVPIGVERAARLTAIATLPVLWLGGVGSHAADVIAGLPARGRPFGLAAIGAWAAPDAAATAGRLRSAFG